MEGDKKTPNNTEIPPRTSVYGSGAMGNLTPEAAEKERLVRAAEKIIKTGQHPDSPLQRLINRFRKK